MSSIGATSVAPFSLRDGDGECLVGPVGADVTPTSHETWYGDKPRPVCLPAPEGRGWSPDRDYRYTERVICTGVRLTVLGELRSRSAVDSIEQRGGQGRRRLEAGPGGAAREVRSQP